MIRTGYGIPVRDGVLLENSSAAAAVATVTAAAVAAAAVAAAAVAVGVDLKKIGLCIKLFQGCVF